VKRIAWVLAVIAITSCHEVIDVASVQTPDWPVPVLGTDVDTIMDAVAKMVFYRDDATGYGVTGYVATPLETYETRRGDCEDYSILALYLLARDAGVYGDMVTGSHDGRGHAWVRIDGENWEPQNGRRNSQSRYTVLWTYSYDEAMAMVGTVTKGLYR
jgi:hypothetical protein